LSERQSLRIPTDRESDIFWNAILLSEYFETERWIVGNSSEPKVGEVFVVSINKQDGSFSGAVMTQDNGIAPFSGRCFDPIRKAR